MHFLDPLPTTISSGFRLLDRELPESQNGRGWPQGSLTELLVRNMGIGELRFLAPTLKQLTQSGRHVVLLAPPHVPYAPAFASMGIAPDKLLVVHAEKPVDRLWAVEQSLKSNQFGALITWLDHSSPSRTDSFRQDSFRPELIRRLQLAARHSNGPVFVFRPWAAQHIPSPAPLRLLLLPRRYPDLAVQIIKRRGPVMLSPIDIAIPIPGSGLHPVDAQEHAIVAPRHAMDRLHHSPSVSAPVSPAPSNIRSAIPH